MLVLEPFTGNALRRQRNQQELARIAASDQWQQFNLVFTTTRGTPQDASNATHRVQRLMGDAGLPRKTLRNLQRIAASPLYTLAMDMKMIQEVLGHSQISLTANTYAHLSPALERDAADRMETFLAASS